MIHKKIWLLARHVLVVISIVLKTCSINFRSPMHECSYLKFRVFIIHATITNVNLRSVI
jgi:hypothetical protein